VRGERGEVEGGGGVYRKERYPRMQPSQQLSYLTQVRFVASIPNMERCLLLSRFGVRGGQTHIHFRVSISKFPNGLLQLHRM
jgi:hypothetical protein